MSQAQPTFWRKRKKSNNKDTKQNKNQRYDENINNSLTFWLERREPEYLLRNGRKKKFTVSVAIPGSLIKNCHTLELKTILIGQIARSLSLFEVDEVIIFVDTGSEQASDLEKGPSAFCYHLLQYIEAPPYLRKKLFPMHPDLKFAGLLPSLDSPHHLRRDDISLYREGIVTSRPAQEGKSYVDVGLQSEVLINHQLRPGIRVTVKLNYEPPDEHGNRPQPTEGIAVSPREPTEKYGLYWGFQIRFARSFGEVFTGCPFVNDNQNDNTTTTNSTSSSSSTTTTSTTSSSTEEINQNGSYDFLIGHSSKRGLNGSSNSVNHPFEDLPTEIPRSGHYLLVFGGPNGLEACIEADEALTISAKNIDTLFDIYWNSNPKNGCRTIKTEEELLISLTRLVPLIRDAHSTS